jgi:hypothetical protein
MKITNGNQGDFLGAPAGHPSVSSEFRGVLDRQNALGTGVAKPALSKLIAGLAQ